jgi:hypothetical protein
MPKMVHMEKQCPNCQAAMAADATTRPGFACYECAKCAFVVIEVVKEAPPAKPGARSTTRGEMLRSEISFALINAVKIVRGFKKGLSDEERHAVAVEVVRSLGKYHADIWKLDEKWPVEPYHLGHGYGQNWRPN